MTLSFPWPPSALRPNAKSPGNWWTKSKAAKSYKADCLILCRSAKLAQVAFAENAKPVLAIMFYPPDKRRRDLDSMLSSFKQGIDAIADTIGIDDSWFALVIAKGESRKHGAVEVTLS